MIWVGDLLSLKPVGKVMVVYDSGFVLFRIEYGFM